MALIDQVQRVARVALVEDDLIPVEPPPSSVGQHASPVILGEAS
jgi:hypothetical protein